MLLIYLRLCCKLVNERGQKSSNPVNLVYGWTLSNETKEIKLSNFPNANEFSHQKIVYV